MLKSLALTMEDGIEIALILGLVICFLTKVRSKSGPVGPASVGAGGLLALVVSSAVIYGMDVDRSLSDGITWGLFPVAAMWFVAWMFKEVRQPEPREEPASRIPSNRISLHPGLVIVAMLLTLPKGIEVVSFPNEIFIMTTNVLNTELLVKVSGGILGLVGALIFGITLVKAAERVRLERFVMGAALVFGLMGLRSLFVLLNALLVFGVIPVTTATVNLTAPVINVLPYFVYPLVVLVLLAVWLARLDRRKSGKSRPPPGRLAELNPAERRKILAYIRRDARWFKSYVVMAFVIVFVLGMNHTSASRKVTLSAAVPVNAVEGAVRIPVGSVNDAKLHRFSYTFPDGTGVRFIIIKKWGGLFGAGLDACQICGNVGYYQRRDDVICLNCDVVMNIETIGFPGGCNPIPLKYMRDGDDLVVLASDLAAEKGEFE